MSVSRHRSLAPRTHVLSARPPTHSKLCSGVEAREVSTSTFRSPTTGPRAANASDSGSARIEMHTGAPAQSRSSTSSRSVEHCGAQRARQAGSAHILHTLARAGSENIDRGRVISPSRSSAKLDASQLTSA